LLLLFSHSTILSYFISKEYIENNINFLLVFLEKTDFSMRLIDFPPKFYIILIAILISVFAFYMKITVFCLFLMNTEYLTSQPPLFFLLRLIVFPVLKLAKRFKILVKMFDEYFTALIISILLFIFFSWLLSGQYNFHQFINCILAAFYNIIDIINFYIFLILVKSFLIIFPKYDFFYISKEIDILIAPIIKPIQQKLSICYKNFDFMVLIVVCCLSIIDYIFTKIIVNIFNSYNLNFIFYK